MKLLNTTSNDQSKILLKIPFLKFDIKLFNTNKQYFFLGYFTTLHQYRFIIFSRFEVQKNRLRIFLYLLLISFKIFG